MPITTHHPSEFSSGRILGLHEPQIGYQQISDYLHILLTTAKDIISKQDLEGKEGEVEEDILRLTSYRMML